MNNVTLMGRLTKDPELRYTSGKNTAVASFTLAVNRDMKSEGQPDADFINIVAWAKTAEFAAKYFVKGQQVAVIGKMQTRTWEDDQKVKHYVTEVVADRAFFADSKKNDGQAPTQSETPPQNNQQQNNQQQGGYQAPSNPPPTGNSPPTDTGKKPWER
jgi:single-strand DNA-binding protein